MARYTVIEAFADRDSGEEVIKMQALASHNSVTAAYWYWGRKGAQHRLFLVDSKKASTYTWDEAHDLMVFESLRRIELEMRVEQNIVTYLTVAKFLTANGDISIKGRDLMQRLEPAPAQSFEIGHIKSATQLRLNRK